MTALRRHGQAVVAIFVATSIVIALQLLSGAVLLRFLHGLASGEPIDRTWASEIDRWDAWLAEARLAAVVLCAIVFLSWFYRAYRNLYLAPLKGLRDTPGTAVVGFLIPFVNLVVPFQVMRKLWMGSKYLAGAIEVESWPAVRPTRRIGWWWGLLLASGFLGGMWAARPAPTTSLQWLQVFVWMRIASDALAIAAALLAISLTREITALQEEARPRLAAAKLLRRTASPIAISGRSP